MHGQAILHQRICVIRYKIINNVGKTCDFFFGITNEKDAKKKDDCCHAMIYEAHCGAIYDYVYAADGKRTKVEHALKDQDIVGVKVDFDKMHLLFFLDGEQVGPNIKIEKGKYRAVR